MAPLPNIANAADKVSRPENKWCSVVITICSHTYVIALGNVFGVLGRVGAQRNRYLYA